MSEQSKNLNASDDTKRSIADSLVYVLALFLVLLGLINVTPAIPGWDDLWKSLTGNDMFRVRRFSSEWLFPITFFWMMLIVALKHSMWRSWVDRSSGVRWAGLVFDIALVAAAAANARVVWKHPPPKTRRNIRPTSGQHSLARRRSALAPPPAAR